MDDLKKRIRKLHSRIEDEEDDIEFGSKMEEEITAVSTLEISTHTKRQMISIAPSLVLKAEEVMLDARLKRDKPYLTHIAKLLKSYLDHSLMKDDRLVDDDLVSRVKALSKQFPNFTPVVEIVATSLRVCQHGQKPLHITPVLIVGEPGIGKTEFLLSLASALGLEREFVDASTIQGSFTLAGTEQHWSSSMPGLISKMILASRFSSAMLHLDEIDKVNREGSNGGDPSAPLHALLESSTAKGFQDACYGSEISFDASLISCFATANDLQLIAAPILSRFNIVRVEKPSEQELLDITQNIHTGLIENCNLMGKIDTVLDLDVLQALALVPREIKRALRFCYGRALENGRQEIILEDLEAAGALVMQSRKTGIGFY